MARASPIVSNFTAGLLTPYKDGRVDLSKYYNGARIMQNMVTLPWGPAQRRPGWRHIAETKNSAKQSRLFDFEFSTEQTYSIEVGERYFRFFRNKGRIVVPATTAVITNGDFASDISGWTNKSTGTGAISHDATNGRMNLAGGGAGNIAWAEQAVNTNETGQEHVVAFQVVGDAGDTIRIRVGTTTGGDELLENTEVRTGFHAIAFTPSTGTTYLQFQNENNKTVQVDKVSLIGSGGSGTVPVEIETPYLEGDLFRFKKSQSFDVMYVLARKYRTRELKRRGHTTWSLEDYLFEDGPYLPQNVDSDKTLTPSAVTGSGITVTATGHEPFQATDVGRLIRLTHGATTGYALITGFTSATQVTADVKTDLGGTTATETWRLGLYSDTDGWPAAATFHEERFWLGGAGGRPDRNDASATDAFTDFKPGTEDDDALAATIAADQVNAIHWLASGRVLLVGTQGAEYRIGADTQAAPLTPTNVQAKAESRHRVADLKPLPLSNAVLFVARHERRVRELAFAIEIDGFRAPDLTILAEHITESGIKDWCYQQEPWSVVWCVRNDGLLIGMTYERDEDVVGWHEHPLSGDGTVEAVCTIPGAKGDELWGIIKRTINGQTKRYVSVMETPQGHNDDIAYAFHVDSGLTLDNTIDATLTPGATTGSGITFTAGSNVFVADDVGRIILYRYKERDDEGQIVNKTARAEITGFTSGTVVTADVHIDFPSTATIGAKLWHMTVTQVSGADHLEGETVQILGDGAVLQEQVVTGGNVPLEVPAATVHVGEPLISRLKPMRFEAGATEGTAQGKIKRVAKLIVRVHRSAGFKFGPDAKSLKQAEFRTAKDLMDMAVPLFSGDKVVQYPGDYERDGDVLIVQDLPLPLTVVCMVPRLRSEA